MMNELLLVFFALMTSTLTAITGIGGGMLLIAIMPGLLPAAAIVPVHGAVQLFANSSRALFGWRHLHWQFVLAFIAGGIVGGLLAAAMRREINLEYTPLLIAAYILYTVWGPKLNLRIPPRGEFVTVGMVQTALSMIIGATGPMGSAALLRQGLRRDALVVSGALMTTFSHLIKIVLFAALGFAFANYWQIIAGMSVAVIAGAFIGTHLRYRIPEARFRVMLKWLLTLLALRMIYLTLF